MPPVIGLYILEKINGVFHAQYINNFLMHWEKEIIRTNPVNGFIGNYTVRWNEDTRTILADLTITNVGDRFDLIWDNVTENGIQLNCRFQGTGVLDSNRLMCGYLMQ